MGVADWTDMAQALENMIMNLLASNNSVPWRFKV